MAKPAPITLPPELKAVQQRWLTLPRKEQDELYAMEFAVPFARLFAALPLHGAPPGMPRPRALVSVLGLAWQPVALMAAWCKPERMLVLGTEESLGLKVNDEEVLPLIARIAGISREVIQPMRVGDPGETDIYAAVRHFLRTSGVPPREIFVDPTGGKKSMSAAAALAGFLAGAPLVYVDYAEYHGPHRIPVAGTEYPRLLTNPLEILGELELRDIFAALARSDFQEAERMAGRLAQRLYAPREAECLAALAKGYGAWDAFKFTDARRYLSRAREMLEQFADQGRWAWAASVRETLEGNLRVLEALQDTKERPDRVEDGVPLIAWYLSKAERMLQAERWSLALLLIYAAIERLVGLCLWVDFRLDVDRPDYSRLRDGLDLGRFHEVGKKLFGERYEPRDPPAQIALMNGLQLLATLAPGRLGGDDLRWLQDLAGARNRCEFEHGFLPQAPRPEQMEKYLSGSRRLIASACGEQALKALLRDCRFPRFRQ